MATKLTVREDVPNRCVLLTIDMRIDEIEQALTQSMLQKDIE